MKKKVVIFLLMICSIVGLFACGSDPYANMSMTVYYNAKEVTDSQVINLDIKDSSGDYDEAVIQVEVNGVNDDTDKSITVSGGEGYVYTSTNFNKISGVTTITVRTVSTDRTGRFSLKIGTSVGNVSREIAFNIDLALETFSFKEDALKAVAKGSSVSLNNLDDLIDFYPRETTQRNLTVELATLVPVSDDVGFVVEDWVDGKVFSYNDDGHEYAQVSNGVLTTFDTYKDLEGEDRKISYPTWTPSASAEGSNDTEEVVVLKASFYSTKYDMYLMDFLPVAVIEVYKESDIKLFMDTVNGNGEEFEIPKSNNGTYDMVLVDGSDMSVEDKINNSYCFERELSFKIFDEAMDRYFDDFKITTSETLENGVIEIKPLNGCETSGDGIIDIYPSASVANIKILAKKPGTYTHEFIVTHKDSKYAGLFDKTIVISFIVKDLPDDIEMYSNGILLNDKNNPQSITIYDYYKGSKGQKVDVKINNEVGEYKYLVLTQGFENIDSINLYSAKSNEKMVFANLVDGVLSSTIEDKNFTLFGANDSFYLSHLFETLSTKSIVLYVGVQVSMYADSYVGGKDFFKDILYLQPVYVNFAMGLRSFEFASNKIYVDLTASKNLSTDCNEGTLLCDLPEGQSMESCLNLSKCRYDSGLISLVESEPAEGNSKKSIMIKANGLRKEGATTLELVARNGVTGTVIVYTYMPTIYKDYTDDNKMPLAIEVNKNDGGYLYSVSGYSTNPSASKDDIYKDYASHDEKLSLGVGDNELKYNSIHTLFGLLSKSVKLSFYDYLDKGDGSFEKFDITNKVKVSFKGVIGYASYNGGVLSFHQLVVNYDKPLEMVVSYVGGYAGIGDDGEPAYKEVTVEQTIYIYIYRAMVGIDVETKKESDLYVMDSLGYFDQALASSVVRAKFSPNEDELGYGWNEIFGEGGEKLVFYYSCSMLDSPITENGKQVEFYPNDSSSGSVYKLKYSDLFEVGNKGKITNSKSYTCEIKSRLSSELRLWINNNYGVGTLSEKIEQFLSECIYGKNYTISITISANQFGKLSNSTTVSYVCKFAPKISSIKLSVNKTTLDDDGIYFDYRDVKSGSALPIEIEYTIDTTACLNKKVRILGENSAHFTVTTTYVSGNTGKIVITPNKYMSGGGLYDGDNALKIVLEDNVYGYQTGDVDKYGYSYYTQSLNQSIRIKIADGSKDFPYEIRSTSDYSKMLNDIKSGSYNYYVLAKDIDISEISNYEPVDIVEDNKIFSLNGNHVYYRNGEKIELYNTIYNLTIKRDISSLNGETYIGLFGKIGSSARLSNLRVENLDISLTTTIANTNTNRVYVGGFAGMMAGAKLSSVAVSGKISVDANIQNSDMFVGGLVGKDLYNAPDVGEIVGNAKSTSETGSANDNANLEISLSGVAGSIYAGGIVGKLDRAKVDTLQVVSNIKSTMRALGGVETIGGAIGVSDGASVIDNIEVSPIITITGENKVGNYGGIIGWLAGGKLTNSKVYFVNVGEVDSYLERLNIRVYNTKSANVGGVVGSVGSNANMEYTYARSFYSNDIESLKYAGNILVTDIENGANVGGVAGLVDTSGIINAVYFDGDVNVGAEKTGDTTIQTNINAGVLFGRITEGEVNNSYAVGRLYYTLTDGSYAPSTNYGYSNGIVGGATYQTREITIGAFNISYPLVHEFNDGVEFSNVYAVVNKAPVFIAFDSIAIMGENAGDLVSKVKNTVPLVFNSLSTPLDVFKLLGYKITDGQKANENDVVANYDWFVNDNIYKIGEYHYPILLTSSGRAMYDLVPAEIGIRFNNSVNNIYDISYIESDGENDIKHNQLIMFMKKKADGTYSKDYYEILSESVNGSENVAVKVVFNGETISTEMVTIPFNDKIEIVLASTNNNNTLALKGNKIYPLNEGVATIEIRSYLDRTVKTTFDIKVVSYLDTIKLYEHGSSVEEVITARGSRTVYVDEVSNFEIVPTSREGYVATSDIGYIFELLDSGKENGSIKVNNTLYTYDSSGNNNVFMLGQNNLKNVVGNSIGYVKFKLTPYIKLGTTKYEDNSYNGVSTSENIFILNKTGMNVSKIYEFKVMSRAVATSTSMPTVSISYNSIVSFTASIETSNVILVNGNYTILEDVYFNLSKFSERINYNSINIVNLSNIANYGNVLGSKYYFETPYIFEHKLVILKISSLTIDRTIVNSENKQNTYRITLDMALTFNSDFYRLNASTNEYDLNSIEFRVDVIPSSNLLYSEGVPYAINNDEIVGITKVGITPIGLTDIFMNYYSRGEGLLDNTENTYPNDNESNKIVPGRDGLLKITLNEEFSNSSYVTVTLDNKYAGYVRIEQMAGVLENIEDVSQFNTYEELIYNEPFNGSTYYGIKLQKLSCNLATNTYFDGTYYIKVTLVEGVNYDALFGVNGKVEIVVTSYTIDNFGNVSETLPQPKVKELTISPLPTLSVHVNGSNNIYMGVGTKKALSINYSHLTNNLIYNISSTTDNIYIMDDSGERVHSLSLEYINEGRAYYLAMSVSVEKGSTYTLEVYGQEYVEGVLESTRSQVIINAVAYEVKNVSLTYSTYNEASQETILSIGHGESKILKLDVSYEDIVVGDKEEVDAYKSMLNTYFKKGSVSEDEFSPKQKLEYALAGTSVTKKSSNIETTIVSNALNLHKVVYFGGQKDFEQITVPGLCGGIDLLTDSYYTSIEGGTIEVKYTLLRGLSISSDTILRISVPYHYQNGDVVAGISSSGIYFDKYIEFRVVINENSSEDHPTPIENQADLAKYAGLTGHYILVNNIELLGWTPIPANFDSLDGNGYTIIVKSFNMSSIRAENNVNAGIFTEISETTLIKNLIIDISYLLVDSTTMNNDIKIVNNSKSSTYVHDQAGKIDLTFVESLNFGVLAGTNNGSLTNIKVVSTRGFGSASSDTDAKYLHILTSLIDENDKRTTSNIGGIVGINSTTGAISNSFVGVNTSEKTVASGISHYYIRTIVNPSNIEYNNDGDEMESLEVYPFVLAGSNKLAGISVENSGIISNSYVKGVGLYNASPNEESSVTAGLVGTNSNKITSSFVEGAEIHAYRDTGANGIVIEAIGNVAGLVYSNTAIIENAYANVYLQTNSSAIAGFVFTNSGSITNAYSTAINRNNLAYGPFTGVVNRVAQNTGVYTNCYYLVCENEVSNDLEVATPMYTSYFGETATMSLADFWNGFSFVSSPSENLDDGIWTIVNNLPTIATTQIDTNSYRTLSETANEYDDEGIIKYTLYTYLYDSSYQEGSVGNPLIIETASKFAQRIIAKSNKETKTFGGYSPNDILGQMSAVEYVRLVNNLDFTDIMVSNPLDGFSLYEMTFAGKFDGNGMSMNNLKISTTTSQLENFGLFGQIGSTMTTSQSVIKNLDIDLIGFTSNNNNKVGVLAGTIINATIANINIDGNGESIVGTNMAGGLAGLIYAYGDNSVSIVDVEISNISVKASHGSIGGTIEGIATSTEDQSYGRYNVFNIYNKEKGISENRSFKHLQTATVDGKLYVSNTSEISYAGAVAGAVIANNSNGISGLNSNERADVNNYRSTFNPSIYNITVKGSIEIGHADHAGGLFGYLSADSRIKNCKLELNDNQTIVAWNFAGGIVAENYGIIEQCFVAYDNSTQDAYDQTIGVEGTSRNNGMASLFANSYTVSVGGIAGYTSGGAIVDCFSKVNVVEPLSFISGGLVGYSYLYNYIGYSYTTGAVYGRDVIGGIVGLQITENDKPNEKLYFDTVVGLNNWANNRDEISSILYSGYKELYKVATGGYSNFHIKMPEVGNQELLLSLAQMDYYNINTSAVRSSILEGAVLGEGQTEDAYVLAKLDEFFGTASNDVREYVGSLSGTTNEVLEGKLKAYYYVQNIASINSLYKTNKETQGNSIFVGSVVGASYNFANSELDPSRPLFLDKNAIDGIYGETNINNTFSTTYGMYKTQSGKLEGGNKNDTYFEQTFSITNDTNSNVTLYSYRIPYVDSDNYYNDYARGGETTSSDIRLNFSDTTRYMDKVNFAKIFTSQEYTEQLVGTFYRTETVGQMNSTYNVFMGYNNDDRYSTTSFEETFVSRTATQSIWNVKNVDDNRLPYINDGSIVSVEHLYAEEDDLKLNNIFTSNTGNATYYLHVGSKSESNTSTDANFTIDIRDKALINYMLTLRAVFIGESRNNVRPRVVFNISEESDVSTIFNAINGAVFSNIDFVININGNNLSKTNKDFDSFGVFANTVEGALFENCSITLNYESAQNINFGSEHNTINNGLMFGLISNSTIKGSTIEFNGISSLELNNQNIQNFGLVAGLSYYSTVSDVTYILDNVQINVNNASDMASIGMMGYLYGSNYWRNHSSSEKTISINQYSNKSIYASSMIGYAYGSSVDLHNVNTYMRLVYNSSVVGVSGVYLGAVAGGSQNTRFADILLSSSEAIVTTSIIGQVKDLSVGAIVGVDSSSTFGISSGTTIIGSRANISVVAKADELYVGGLVGKTKGQTKMFNVYSNGVVSVENSLSGSMTGTSDKPNYVYAKTYVGVMIGGANGSIVMSSILSAGDIVIGAVGEQYSEVALGGVIGYLNYSCDLSKFTVITDIKSSTSISDKVTIGYASHVLGLNEGSFSANNGYVYSEFVGISSKFTTSAITNNRINSATNVFYAREFAGNNYTSDSKFMAYAYADILGSISDYSDIKVLSTGVLNSTLASVVLKGSDGTLTSSNVVLPVVESLRNVVVTKVSSLASLSAGFNRLYLKEVNNNPENIYAEAGYVAITENVEISHIDELKSGQHISGRTTVDGKVIVTLGYSYNDTHYGNLVGTNNGVISNIYLRSSKENNNTVYALNVSLVGTNNGLITGVYVYERTQSQFGIANVNNGTICASATATVYFGEVNKTDIYGLVNENKGLIADCYSASVGYWENSATKGQVYMINKNSGTIINSFYYIPEVITYFNIQKVICKETIKDSSAIVSNCSSEQNSGQILSRSNIWTSENGHAQLRGIKDIKNAMVVHLHYGLSASSQVEIISVANVKESMKNNANKNYVFTCKISFYEADADLPVYKVISILNGNSLFAYIDSLGENAIIPDNTIVALYGDIDISSLPAFGLGNNAMFVGVYHRVKNGDVETAVETSTINFKSELNHSLITTNAGIVANLKFKRLSVKYEDQGAVFAPIDTNSGIINNISFEGLKVSALNCSRVAGILCRNDSTGVVYDVSLSSVDFISGYAYVKYIYNNVGFAGSCSMSGKNNFNDRWWDVSGNGVYNG